MQMVEDIELGKVETHPMDEVIDRIKGDLNDEEPT